MFRLIFIFVILFVLCISPVNAQLGGQNIPDLSGFADAIAKSATAPVNNNKPAGGAFKSGLNVPSINPGAAARDIGKQLRTSIEQKAGPQPALAQLEAGMPGILTNVETELEKIGFAKRDFGVAIGYAFIYNYETATKQTVPPQASEIAAKTVAIAIKQFWGTNYSKITPADQERMYESLIVSTTLMSALAQQFAQAGKTQEETAIRQAAGQIFEKLIGVAPANVKIAADGKITGLAAGKPANNLKSTDNQSSQSNNLPIAANNSGSSAASLNGVKIFVKYWISYSTAMKTEIENLLLFPDGTAFDAIPNDPMPGLDAATLKKMLKPREVGRWKITGNNLVLTFPEETRTLKKHPKGWYDGTDTPKADNAYNIYYPVSAANQKQLVGAWKSSNMTTLGMIGGGAPMVAAGSNSNLNLNLDGTFNNLRKSFASATTANMGDAYKGDGSVGTYSNKRNDAAGRWRLDGLLLTFEEKGMRRVYLTYLMPYWSKNIANTGLMIGTDRWERSDKK